MPLRAVLVDFGNVVAFFDHQKACRQLAALSTTSLSADEVHRAVFDTRLETDYDSGRLSTTQFLDAMRETLRLEATDDQIDQAWSDIFTPNPSMADLIPALTTRGLRLVLGSNTNALHHRWFSRVFGETLAAFDEQIVSYRVGHRKPDRRFYEACLGAAGCAARECLYIDDRPDFVEAGRAMGMSGLVYSPGTDVWPALADE